MHLTGQAKNIDGFVAWRLEVVQHAPEDVVVNAPHWCIVPQLMNYALLTWSDRGAEGPQPSYHTHRASTDRGPIARLLGTWRDCPTYDAIWVLTNRAGEARARALCSELENKAERVVCHVLAVEDPSDHAQLFRALGPLVALVDQRLPRETWNRDVILSAGTPQMQTLWVILAQAGLLDARMLQVIPDAFVPHPHPSPVRQVRLDIEGFPEIRALREEVKRLHASSSWKGWALVGESASMRFLQMRARRVAESELPILIRGETGTGKELLARAIHEASARASGPFVAENCAALTESLLGSELFGHEKGAFTGAVAKRRGLFELAHGGTLFLDEVGDMPLTVQAHLLRVLQERVVRRVGGETTIRVDVRLVTATHRDLRERSKSGAFREDLYYRLRGAELQLPALRERKEDIVPLVNHFLHEAPARRLELEPRVLGALERYAWPGNVRELRSEVTRWKVFCSRRVDAGDLSCELLEGGQSPVLPRSSSTDSRVVPLADAVRATERMVIEQALAAHAGNLSRAAKALGIDRHTLKRKLGR